MLNFLLGVMASLVAAGVCKIVATVHRRKNLVLLLGGFLVNIGTWVMEKGGI